MNAILPSRAHRWHTPALAALLVAAAVVAYWPALTGGFVWDDDTLLTKSDLVKAANGLYRMWFTTEPIDYWPLTNTSFWLEWRLWGMHALGYHLTNLLLHISSGFLVWAILRRLALPGAWLAACLFVLHPVNVESVAWIAQRKNTLSMVFFLLSILCYLMHDIGPVDPAAVRPPQTTSGKRRRRPVVSSPRNTSDTNWWYWLSLAAFVLAMLSKGSVAILPGVLLLLIWWRRGSVTHADVIRAAPFFFVAIALTGVNIWFQNHLVTGVIRHVTLVQRVLGAGAIVWFYLYKALVPIGLVFVYPQWTIRVEDVHWWLPLVAFVGVTTMLVWQRRRPVARALLFAWAFFCLALLPVMGLTDVYYMTYSLVADHYQYIAILGVVAGVAAILTQATARIKVSALRAIPSAALLVVLAAATWWQSHQYVDAETLYRATLRRNPSCWLVQNLLGVVLVDHSIDEAIVHFRAALRLKPDLVEAHNNLCQASDQVGQLNDALAECSAALRINPNLATAHNGLGLALASLGRSGPARAEFEAALRLKEDYAEAHNNLANVLETTGDERDAIDHYREAVQLTPDFAAAHSNLGSALERQGRIDEAIAQYQDALRIDSTLTEARYHLSGLLQKSGRSDAIAHYQEALRLTPNQPGLHVNLGDALLEAGRSQDAVAEYTVALKALPDSPTAHSGLASALADLGRFEEAEAQFQEAIRLKPDFAEAHRNLGDLLEERGHHEDAVTQYTASIRDDSHNAEAHNNLGVVLVRLGRIDEAVDHFKAALTIQPNYPDARTNLDKVLRQHKVP